MTFYWPPAFIFLITIPLIIMLYLLKQRHQDYTVSSLYLWNAVLKDLEANAPWQKLRRNILMFLQIAAMALLAFALSRPFINSAGGNAPNVIIAIDSSLSMQASDTAPSRFEAAKKQASEIVSNLQPGTQVTLISIGSRSTIVENMSRDKNSLLSKIRQLEALNEAADFEDASTLIQPIAKQYPGTEIFVLGDNEFTIPGVNIKMYNYSKNGGNYAVAALSHASSAKGITVLSRIANFSSEEKVIPVSLYVNGKVFDAKNVQTKPGETVNVYWNSIPDTATSIECRIDSKDSLENDNSAWDWVNKSKTSKALLISEKNIFIEKAVSIMNGIKLYKTNPDSRKILKGYDLYIFDGFLPEKLPSDGNIMVFNPPANNLFNVSGEVKNPVTEKSKHPLFNYVTDFSFSIGKAKKISLPKWGQAVLDSNAGPVIFSGELENRRLLVFGFDVHQSDIALTSAFPILMSNSVEWLVPSRIKNIDTLYPGQSVEFNLDPKAESVSVKSPSGKITKLAPPFPAGVFDNTSELGLYSLEQVTPSGVLRHGFSVNPPAEQESNLSSSSVKTQGVNSPGKNSAPVSTGLNLQVILLWIVFILMLIEWWVYKNDI